MLQKQIPRRLLRQDEGSSAVEYGVMLAGVAAIIVIIVFSLGSPVQATFKSFCDNLSSRMGGGLSCSDGSPPAPSEPPPSIPASPPAPPPSGGGDDDDDGGGGHHHGGGHGHGD